MAPGVPKSVKTIYIRSQHQIQLFQVRIRIRSSGIPFILYLITGENFKIYILVGDQRFHIAINDEPYCTYYFRVPLNHIQTVEITDDIQSVVQVDHRSVYPTAFPATHLDDKKIEFSNDIPKKFTPGKYFGATKCP